MPKLYSSDYIIRILLQHSFLFISQKGSHAKYRKTGNPSLTVIVPAGRKEMPQGTFNSILKQSGLKKTDFEK
jgi:predicted RNA binding protein YcfA (HicA-like mRNA interferase family)